MPQQAGGEGGLVTLRLGPELVSLFHATCQSWHVNRCLSGELVAFVHYRLACKEMAMGALEMYGSRVRVLFLRPLD